MNSRILLSLLIEIDVNNSFKTFTIAMLKTIVADLYNEWTLKQIKLEEKYYRALFIIIC